MDENNKTRLMQFIKHLGMSTRTFEQNRHFKIVFVKGSIKKNMT